MDNWSRSAGTRNARETRLPHGDARSHDPFSRSACGARVRNGKAEPVRSPRGRAGQAQRLNERARRVVRGVSRGVSGILPVVIVLEVSRPYDVIEARLGGLRVAGIPGSRFRLRRPHPTLTNP